MNYSNTSLRTGNITKDNMGITPLESTSIAVTLCLFLMCCFSLIRFKKKHDFSVFRYIPMLLNLMPNSDTHSPLGLHK